MCCTGIVGSEQEYLSVTHEWPTLITLGKVRLALRYTIAAAGQASGQIILWISAANIERGYLRDPRSCKPPRSRSPRAECETCGSSAMARSEICSMVTGDGYQRDVLAVENHAYSMH